MALPVPPPGYTRGEEIANALTHGLAAVAAVVALVLMLRQGTPVLSPGGLAGVAIYGGSLVALFLASTLYHASDDPRRKAILRRIDHGAIYVLIAGTYTPLMAITLDSGASTWLLAIVWSLAIAGVVFKVFFVDRFERLSLATYLLMGWLALFVVHELWDALPRAGFWLLIAGGLCFTVGTYFYARKDRRYTHAIWHAWVVAGAACHCATVGFYVIPS